MIKSAGSLVGALLDVKLADRPVDDVAALTRRNIPFAFVTGDGCETLQEAFREATLIAKPIRPEELLEALRQLLLPSNIAETPPRASSQ